MIRRVAVVMGGTESEHEISVRSGREVLEHLPPDRYETLAVTWRTDGRFEIPSGSEPVEAAAALAALREVDVAFLALHGPGGEDGRIQGFLETAGIAYTGSGVLGSALAMDKLLTKDVARRCGLETPPHATDIGADDVESCSRVARSAVILPPEIADSGLDHV